MPAPDIPVPDVPDAQSRPATTTPPMTLTAPIATVTANAAAFPVLLMLMTTPSQTLDERDGIRERRQPPWNLSSLERATDFFQGS